MAQGELRLFGHFELAFGTAGHLTLRGQKDRALLAVLAISPGTRHARGRLAGLLWSEHDEAHARDSLKHSLSRLRACLEPAGVECLRTDRQTVGIDPASLRVDVAEFERLIAQRPGPDIEKIMTLYRGELLEDLQVADPAFEDWLIVAREDLRRKAETVGGEVLASLEPDGPREKILAVAEWLLARDPLRETACRALMRQHTAIGETALALRTYERLRARLKSDLGIDPEDETVRLAEAIHQRRTGAPLSLIEPLSGAPPRAAALPLPDKPSIAVLPFQNLSGDPDQEYFADGVVEDLTTALSRIAGLFVISRSSSFTFKGKAVDVRQIGRELGVRYLLEGSVRRALGKVRITGRLVEAATGGQLWSESFDGEIEDIFALQDRVAAEVAGALAPTLERVEIERVKDKPTASLDAYDCFLRGMAAVHLWTRRGNAEALAMFERAVRLDPGYGAAYGMAARCYSQRRACGWAVDAEREVSEVRRLSGCVLQTGWDDAVALATAGIGLSFVAGDLDAGATLIDRAREINPNLGMAWLFSGWTRIWLGDQSAALDHLGRAMRLSPQDPQHAMMYAATACAHFLSGANSEAIGWAEKSVQLQPNYRIALCILAASQAAAGKCSSAQDTGRKLRQLSPDLRIPDLLATFPIRRAADLDRWTASLRRAGLPE